MRVLLRVVGCRSVATMTGTTAAQGKMLTLGALIAADASNGALLTSLLHFLNQRDVAQLWGEWTLLLALHTLAPHISRLIAPLVCVAALSPATPCSSSRQPSRGRLTTLPASVQSSVAQPRPAGEVSPPLLPLPLARAFHLLLTVAGHCCCRCVVSVSAGSTLRQVSGVVGLCGSVRRLCLFLCSRLSDSEVQAVATFSSLTALDMGGCHGLTDDALRFISSGSGSGKLRSLQWLSLYWCPGLTDRGVGYLSAGLDCTALRHLSLR